MATETRHEYQEKTGKTLDATGRSSLPGEWNTRLFVGLVGELRKVGLVLTSILVLQARFLMGQTAGSLGDK